uniref:Tumor necrosis factor receptor superfamily member 10A n=1 Tax=Monodelphis domestica TaxID=13616 RepID=F7EED4_MONDO
MRMGRRLLCLEGIKRYRVRHHLELRNPGTETSFQRWDVHQATQYLVTCRLSLCMILIVLLGASQASAETQQRLRKRQSLCPPGQFLHMTKTSDTTLEVCSPCPNGTFTEFPNGLPSCIQCRICRTDQEETVPCHATHNTKCQCRSGTFCPKEHPCEICRKCTSECPREMVEKNPCSPSSDLECQEPTGTRNDGIWITVGIFLLFLLVLVIFCCCKSTPTTGSMNPFGIKSYLVSLLQRGNHPRPPEARGDEPLEMQNLSGKQREEHEELLEVRTIPIPENGCLMEPAEAMTPQAKLFPANGDPIGTLQKSFVIFAQKVPWQYWNQYMNLLGLSPNEIAMAKESENVIDYPHRMLTMWQQKVGKAATVDILLETLSKIKLKAARESIQEELIHEKLYVYKESEPEKSLT